jgi:hypothetical protein
MSIDPSVPEAIDARRPELLRGSPAFDAGTRPTVTVGPADAGSVFPMAPQSVPVFVAALAEPLLAVLCLLLSALWLGQPLDDSVTLLCVFTMTLMFPGTNRFYERPSRSAVDIATAWAAVVIILLLCGYASDSLRFFQRDVAVAWVLGTPVVQLSFVLAGRWLMRRFAAQPERRRPARSSVGARSAPGSPRPSWRGRRMAMTWSVTSRTGIRTAATSAPASACLAGSMTCPRSFANTTSGRPTSPSP